MIVEEYFVRYVLHSQSKLLCIKDTGLHQYSSLAKEVRRIDGRYDKDCGSNPPVPLFEKGGRDRASSCLMASARQIYGKEIDI